MIQAEYVAVGDTNTPTQVPSKSFSPSLSTIPSRLPTESNIPNLSISSFPSGLSSLVQPSDQPSYNPLSQSIEPTQLKQPSFSPLNFATTEATTTIFLQENLRVDVVDSDTHKYIIPLSDDSSSTRYSGGSIALHESHQIPVIFRYWSPEFLPFGSLREANFRSFF